MEGVAGMMARLSHEPDCSRAGLYGPANIDFRFVYELRLQQALGLLKLHLRRHPFRVGTQSEKSIFL